MTDVEGLAMGEAEAPIAALARGWQPVQKGPDAFPWLEGIKHSQR